MPRERSTKCVGPCATVGVAQTGSRVSGGATFGGRSSHPPGPERGRAARCVRQLARILHACTHACPVSSQTEGQPSFPVAAWAPRPPNAEGEQFPSLLRAPVRNGRRETRSHHSVRLRTQRWKESVGCAAVPPPNTPYVFARSFSRKPATKALLMRTVRF